MRKSRLITLAAAASLTAVLAAAPIASADDYFLKIDGVTGESLAIGTQGAIQVDSFEWSAKNQNTIGSMSGGAGTGKAELNEITIEKKVDSTSPILFQKLGQGTVIPGMELAARRVTGTNPQIYVRYTFQPVFVTSQTHSGSRGDDGTHEKLVFSYGAVKQTFAKQSATGVTTGIVFGAWNQVTNSSEMLIPGMTDTSNVVRFK